MKAKIFAKLKQEYSSLGLGDEYLMSKADSLAATGLVTDDNIDAVVACQRKEIPPNGNRPSAASATKSGKQPPRLLKPST